MVNGIFKCLSTAATLACGFGSSVAGVMVLGPENIGRLEARAAVIGGIAYSVLYASGMGERSHRYLGGLGVQVVIALLAGMYAEANSSECHPVSFNLPAFLAATAMSFIIQTAFYACGSGMSFRVTVLNTNDGREASPEHVSDLLDRTNSSNDKSKAVVPRYQQQDDEFYSPLVPNLGQVGIGGMKVESPGSVIVEAELNSDEHKSILGNTTHKTLHYTTASGAQIVEAKHDFNGWLTSRTKRFKTFKAGGGGGMSHVKGSGSDEKPTIEGDDKW